MRSPLFAALILTVPASAQYFQQEADYDMRARLDPAEHTIAVEGTLTYTNHAPHALDSVALHLWANAYANRDSPFGQQLLRLGRTDFAFAADEALGGYRELQFSTDAGLTARYDNPELIWLTPSRPVGPGESLRVDFSYELRVPRTFSRMGRSQDTYALTQWFPKPAVYDATGWHTMPYLDAGEFFSEFGDYVVEVTVPSNGIVAATGQLTNDEGIRARERRLAATHAEPLIVDSLRYDADASVTFRYAATGVHDFAWFASPAFRIRVDTADLVRGPTPAFAYFPGRSAEGRWDSAAAFLARAVAFADSVVGPYPYPQISAVRGPLGTGGGMEYPMITVIGGTGSSRSLDQVLAHEAFHNYFQGHLASNEREHAWMDEGLTSWLEGRYMDQYYPPEDALLGGFVPGFLKPRTPVGTDYLIHAGLAAARRHPAPDTHPDSLNSIGYGYAAYFQPNLLFDLLDERLGGDVLEARLRDYYAAWGGRHPGPRDLQTSLGGKSVSWLFDDLLLDNALPNYSLESVTRTADSVTLTVTNSGGATSPLGLAFAGSAGEYGAVRWIDGFAGRRTLTIPAPPDARHVAIDPLALTPEVDRSDNYYRLGGGLAPKLEPLGLSPLTNFNVGDRNVVNLVPALGYNYADGLLPGVGLHNYSLLNRGTRFYLFPQIALRDASLNGVAGLKHSWYRDDARWREVQLSVEGRSYHYHFDEVYDYNDRFARVTVGGEVLLAAAPGLPLDRRVGLRGHFVRQRYATGIDAAAGLFREDTRGYGIAEADYVQDRNDALRPYRWEVSAQAGEGFARVSSALSAGLRYNEGPNFVRARVFAGAFVHHDEPEVRALLLPNGLTGFLEQQYDYTFEEFIVDRSGASQQTFTRDGSLSLPYPLPVLGSDSWLASATVTVDAPLNLPAIELQAYLDAALYPDSRPDASGTVLPVTGGIRLAVLDGLAEVSLPLLNNAFVRESLPFNIAEPDYWDRVAFRFRLGVANVDELLRRVRG